MGDLLRGAVWLGVLALLMLGLALFSARPMVAAACPQCFGLSKLSDGIYVESSMAPAARAHVSETLAAAEHKLAAFYGEERHVPRALFCASDACYHRIGGAPGSGTGTMGSLALVVAPEATDTVALSEALAHVELRGRVGTWKMEMGAVPEWFEQGLAVVVADDPLYIRPARYKDRCLAGPFPDMPATQTEWQEELGRVGEMLYAQESACKTYMWMESNGGPAGITTLLGKVADGQSFDALYH